MLSLTRPDEQSGRPSVCLADQLKRLSLFLPWQLFPSSFLALEIILSFSLGRWAERGSSRDGPLGVPFSPRCVVGFFVSAAKPASPVRSIFVRK